ncbi:hypothetical protein HHX48_07845 [Salinimonas sp. HHU 13199]|uniref:Uncharacterized protein n=1 Tax=Salinimonas profundi TaxID=2729140 RepID=A0ABR8LL21_9ALTE|nr:hypothetical protein [Salinimonas profundi]MBD3585641.1 hypothetical protein [Salinimonas profundi]
MTNTVSQLKQQLPIERLSLDVLFALRLLFDKKQDISNLEQDIADLQHFPERISDSYRAEWEAYVRREIIGYLRQNSHTAASDLLDKILSDVDYITQNDCRYRTMLDIIEQTQRIMASQKTRIFPTPWRQQITSLMLPAIVDNRNRFPKDK